MAVLHFVVPADWAGAKLGIFLRQVHGVSGTTLKRAKRIPDGILLDGAHCRTVDPIRAGGVISLTVDAVERSYRPCDRAVAILYRDDAIVVYNKPAGMPCHPSKGHPFGTLANVFAADERFAGLVFRPLGRLDADTSGTVLCALHAHAAYAIGNAAEKSYLALCEGYLPAAAGTVDAPIGRVSEESATRQVCVDGQQAITHYRVLQRCEGYSLVSLYLETGRTHQIRVHMAQLGCPLAGDVRYGGHTELLARHALHCVRLTVTSPLSGERVEVEAPMPQDMADTLHRLFGDRLFL